MILQVDSDALYMSLPEARSCAGGFFYLSTIVDRTVTPPLNGTIHVISNKIRNVMTSAAEAEVRALYENCQEIMAVRNTLASLGFKQPATPVKTDNQTAVGITTSTMKQRKTRAMDMRFYWLRDRHDQHLIDIYWKPGPENLADYFTKHHPAAHHSAVRDTYLLPVEHK